MPKATPLSSTPSLTSARTAPVERAATAPVTHATVTVEGEAPVATAADDFGLQDPGLAQLLAELKGDAATLTQVPQAVDRLVTIFGTARSKPVPGENGFADFVWSEELGRELRKASYSISTGAGPGAMEAPLKGHAAMDALMDMKAHRAIGWEAGEPGREGANIKLPKEQAATPYISPEHLSTFKRFIFRMQFLFRDNVQPPQSRNDKLEWHMSPKLSTPGGYGTVAELFTYLAMKMHGQATEPVVLGSHDDFFDRFADAFVPLMAPAERSELGRRFHDPQTLVREMAKMRRLDPPVDPRTVVPRMMEDLERGLTRLDGKPKAVAFFAGGGERTQATLGSIEKIAEGLTRAGQAVRVSGSPMGDEAVLRGVQKANPDAQIEAFALDDSTAEDHGPLHYDRVHDVLVLRELMNTNISGIVTTPEGARQIALLFTAACDVQTGKLPKLPIVVLDPDGKFAALKEQLRELMISPERQYINPEDLDLFTVTNDPAVAMQALTAPPAAPQQ
ncbi:MAG: LOG family protein [Archangiaceae bacterium]|nr:LOG family protein [Archangiaceae bacterium]